MNVFDQVHTEIGAKPILSKQLAKGALAWIPNDTLVNQIQNIEVHNSPLMNVVRNVHKCNFSVNHVQLSYQKYKIVISTE